MRRISYKATESRSKRMVFGLALAVVAALALVAAGCGGDDDDGGASADTSAASETGGGGGGGCDKSIWVLLPDSASSPRWETDDRPYFDQAFSDAGVDHTIVNAEGDAATQQSQAEQAIADGAGVIVLTSIDTGSGGAIIDSAKEAGVDVIEYDRFNTGSSGGSAYVSFDNVAVGATMADVLEPIIDELASDPKQVVMLNGGEEDNNAFLFRDGYNATVEEQRQRRRAGRWSPTSSSPAGARTARVRRSWSRSSPTRTTRSTRCSPPTTTSRSRRSTRSRPRASRSVPLSGQDATAAGIQNILLGKQTMTVYKPIQAEADVAANAALALCAGEDPSTITSDFEFQTIGITAEDGKPADAAEGEGVVPYLALTPTGVTVDNIGDTVIADGFRTVEEICTGDTASTDFCQENS